jgi:hypothetical protein
MRALSFRQAQQVQQFNTQGYAVRKPNPVSTGCGNHLGDRQGPKRYDRCRYSSKWKKP